MSAADAKRPVGCTNPNYARGLLERVLLVPCPYCGASRDERCIGSNGRRIKSRHWVRAEAAKEAGVVLGKRSDLGHVRQVHHELLAVLAIFPQGGA